MFKTGFGDSNDFESVARQYWSAWGDAMRQAGMGAPASTAAPQWQQAVDWWSQLLPNQASPANDAVNRMQQQASQWYGQIQQLAAQFSERQSSPSDVTEAWRNALGAMGENPFPDMFKAIRGKGANGMDEWIEQAKPYIDGLLEQSQRWSKMPAFGQYREHQERLQRLHRAQQEYVQRTTDYNELMKQCTQRALEVFQNMLTAHEQPGQQISSARALFDLWIDAAENAYSEIALSNEFRKVSGALSNAQMGLRAAMQTEVEQLTSMLGMPSRTEIDSAHRKIAELERTLRRAGVSAKNVLKKSIKPATAATNLEPSSVEIVPAGSRAKARKRKSSNKQVAVTKKVVAKQAAAQKPAASKKIAAKPAPVKTVAAKPKVIKKASVKKVATKKATANKSATKAVAKKAGTKLQAKKKTVKKTSKNSATSGNTWVRRNLGAANSVVAKPGARK